MNEYDDLIKGDKQNELRSSIYVASQQQPDTEATLQKLAERWSLPVDAVRQKRPEIELHDKIETFDYEKAIKENPKLSSWLSDPKNAAIAQDDYNTLSGLEKLMVDGKDYAGALGSGVIGQGIGSTLSGLGELYGVGVRSIDRVLTNVLPKAASDVLHTPIPWWLSPESILKRPGKSLKQLGDYMAPPPQRQTIGTDVAQGIGQLGFQISSYLATGGLSTTGMLYAQGADIMADKTAKDIADPALKDTAIVAGGAITALTEKYGLDKILNRVPPEIKNRTMRFLADKVAAGGIEAGQEFTEGLLHDITRRVLTNEDAKVLDGVDREMTAAGLSAAVVRTALGVRGFRAAQQTEDFFNALGDMAKGSKTRERLPDRFKTLLDRYTEDGPVQNVFVPAQQFQQYFQSVGLDPQQVAGQVGAKNFTEALATGGDVVIPMSDFATHIAPTDHLQGLMPDLRLSQDEMTIREAKLEEANKDENDRRLQEEIARINAEAKNSDQLDTAIQKIISDVEGQLLSRYDQNTARNLATVMRGVAVLAQRANPDMNPVEAARSLWAKYGLDIRANPLPKILTEGRDFNATIDPLLDRLRTGDIPSQTDMLGQTLIDFIHSKGGVKEGYGELKDANLNYGKGEQKLVREGGLSLDDLQALAAEAGFFNGEVDETTLLNAIAEGLAGNHTYSIQNENADVIGLSGALEELDKYLSDLGVDLSKMDNAQIKELLRSNGTEYNQALPETIDVDGVQRPTTNSEGRQLYPTEEGVRNFWRWFGDSKAVDAEGRPMVIYHGNGGDFSVFNTEGGKGKTHGTGAFFSSSPDVAATYSTGGNSNVMPVYLRLATPAQFDGNGKNWNNLDKKTRVNLPKVTVSDQADADLLAELTGEPAQQGATKTLKARSTTLGKLMPDEFGYGDETASTDDLARWARQQGYDGVIFDNVVDQGPSGRYATDQSSEANNIYVVFDPAQVKSATGNNGQFDPSNPSILFQGVDQTQSEAFKRWSNDAPLITSADAETHDFKTGEKLVVEAYHGTGRPDRVGTVFQKKRATSGPMAFFTSSPVLASSYAEGKQDTSLAYEDQNYTNWFKYKPKGSRSAMDIVRAWYSLDSATQAKIRETAPKISLDPEGSGEIVVREDNDRGNGSYDYHYQQTKRGYGGGNPLEALVEDWLNSGNLYDDEERFIEVLRKAGFPANDVQYDSPHVSYPSVYKTFVQMQNPLVTSDIPQEVTDALEAAAKKDRSRAAAGGADMWDKNTRTLRDWVAEFRNPDNKYVWTSIPDKVTEVFKSLGYDGIIDWSGKNGSSLVAPVYIPFAETQVKSATGNKGTFDPSKKDILKQDNRGSIEIGTDRKMRINLFEKANLSTFVHEAGHFYLEVLGDLAEADGSSQEVKDDYAKILQFLGVNSRGELGVEQHEKFARANEAYLMEGKAPAAELQGVFQRIRAWMKLIYKQLSNLNVELSDEVRGVFDRIYATDFEIEQASQQANIPHLLATAADLGITEAEFAAYKAKIAGTAAEAKDELQAKLMRIERLKRESWWKEERAKVAEQVAADYDQTPGAQAMDRLTATDSDVRLNRAQLVERYGDNITKRIARAYGEGRGAVYSDEGVDIDTAAEVLGFNSADDMIEALVNLPNKKRFVAAESDRIMSERHGDLLNDIALADEAMLALHNDKREEVLRIELRLLGKRMRDVAPHLKVERDRQKAERRAAVDVARTPPPAQLRLMAAGMIGQKEVRDLNPYGYLLAERKAANAAFEAMAKGDLQAAYTEKQRELLNHYLYREALKAKQESEKIVKYLKGFETPAMRGKLGKAGADYLDQIDGLLERYEFKNKSLVSLAARESLANFVAQQEELGNAVSIPLELINDAKQVNWRTVPVDELRALRDAVKNIAHLANLKNKLMLKGKLVEWEDAKGELLDAAANSGLKSTGDLSRPNKKFFKIRDKGAAGWRKFDASHIKVEQLIEWLDGGKIDGAWARLFFDQAAAAQTQEYELHKLVTTRIQALSDSMPKEWRNSLDESSSVRVPGFADPLNRYTLISIALNMGNAQNIQRLRDGYGWSEQDFRAILGALSTDDMRFVQGLWDSIEELWPFMADLEKRMAGVPPEKVEALAFEHNGVEYRGGYFPLVYDPKKSGAGEKQANEAESVQNFLAQGYGRAATNRGATKQRVETLKAPVYLDYEYVISGHLAKVIKDISHREAVIGINKILTDGDVKETLIDLLGEDRYTEMRQWLQVLVNDRADSLTAGKWQARLLMATRTNLAIVSMGWKISTTLSQLAGFGPSLDLVKPSFLGKALIRSAQHPLETWQFVQEKSGEMRHRANTLDRDVKDAMLRMRGEGGIAAEVRRTAFYLTAMADRTVSVPTWLGAYEQALAEGHDEESAIRSGDRAVRLSQGGGGAKDLAAVQRNGELMKLITMFYTPFNVLYARLRDVGQQTATEGIGYLPTAVARLISLVILPAVLGELLTGRGPDDDEDEVWWAIRKSLLYPLASVPLVRDLAGYGEAAMIRASGNGKMDYAPSFKLSPIVGQIEKLIKIPGKVIDAYEGNKPKDDVAWDVLESSGIIFGLPTGQVRITGEYLEDLMTGDAQPENAMQLLRDSLFKRRKN